MSDFWSARLFFSRNLLGRIFFSPSQCSAGYYFFSVLIYLQDFFTGVNAELKFIVDHSLYICEK